MKAINERAKKPENKAARKHATEERRRSHAHPRRRNDPILQRTCACGGGCPRCQVPVQAKLRVNTPGDKYEREADRVAEQVMRMSATESPVRHGITEEISRNGSSNGTAVNDETKQRLKSATMGGKPLSKATRGFFEPRFGQDLGEVRVHYNSRAAKAANAVNARAYTVGQHIVFGKGEYSPQTNSGKELLAHELTHTLQQSQNRGTQPGRATENGAEKGAHAISNTVIQRQSDDEGSTGRNYSRLPSPGDDESIYLHERRNAAEASDAELAREIEQTRHDLELVNEAVSVHETWGILGITVIGGLLGAIAGSYVPVVGNIIGGIIGAATGVLGSGVLGNKLGTIQSAIRDKLRAWEEELFQRETGLSKAPPTPAQEEHEVFDRIARYRGVRDFDSLHSVRPFDEMEDQEARHILEHAGTRREAAVVLIRISHMIDRSDMERWIQIYSELYPPQQYPQVEIESQHLIIEAR